METFPIPRLDAAQLRAVAESSPLAGCDDCRALECPGWEATSATFDESRLRRLGRLAAQGGDELEAEPTFAEHHPEGTRYWSANAPIAIEYFPYNRCEVWACKRCSRAFLRYTEYGGYYVEPRIRLLDPALLTRADTATK